MLSLLLHHIRELPIYSTNRCNSRCEICNIWRKKPKYDLDINIFKNILKSKSIDSRALFVLTGGEFILHPGYEKILSLFSGRNYILCSNGILADLLIETVRKFKVKNLNLSLDGPPVTYKVVRGIDNYANIVKIIDELKNDNVKINIDYTINPWNSFEDLKYVMRFCREKNVTFDPAYYDNVEYFDTHTEAGLLYNVGDYFPNSYYLHARNLWLRGNLKIPCFSIRLRPVIMPNGDVNLCEAKEIKVGNLYNQSLDEIWNSKRCLTLQKSMFNCNGCWLDCPRAIDISIAKLLKSFLPDFSLKKIVGIMSQEKIPSYWISLYMSDFEFLRKFN